MIVDAILNLFAGMVNTVLGWIPTIPAPDLSGWVSGLSGVWANVGWLNKYVPVDQAAIMLGIVAGAWIVLYGIRFTVWLLTKAHILGGE